MLERIRGMQAGLRQPLHIKSQARIETGQRLLDVVKHQEPVLRKLRRLQAHASAPSAGLSDRPVWSSRAWMYWSSCNS